MVTKKETIYILIIMVLMFLQFVTLMLWFNTELSVQAKINTINILETENNRLNLNLNQCYEVQEQNNLNKFLKNKNLCENYASLNKTNGIIKGGEIYYNINNEFINIKEIKESCLTWLE